MLSPKAAQSLRAPPLLFSLVSQQLPATSCPWECARQAGSCNARAPTFPFSSSRLASLSVSWKASRKPLLNRLHLLKLCLFLLFSSSPSLFPALSPRGASLLLLRLRLRSSCLAVHCLAATLPHPPPLITRLSNSRAVRSV